MIFFSAVLLDIGETSQNYCVNQITNYRKKTSTFKLRLPNYCKLLLLIKLMFYVVFHMIWFYYIQKLTKAKLRTIDSNYKILKSQLAL